MSPQCAPNQTQQEATALQEYKRVLEIPFSSSRKMMLTVTDVSGRKELEGH